MDIPGYYYDQERKKYFKIQTNSPASSAYSSQDVKRRKTRDGRNEANALEATRQRGLIRRAKLLEEPLAGGILSREFGQNSLKAAEIFAHELVRQGHLCSMTRFSPCSDPLFTVTRRPDLGPSLVDIRMTFDDQLFTIRANIDKNTRSTRHASIEICHDGSVPTVTNASWRLERFGNAGTSTSLTTNDTNNRLAMTWLAGSPQSGIAIVPMTGMPRDGGFDGPSILLGPGHTRGPEVNVYSSSPALPNSSLLFAFGCSHGILTCDKRDYDMTWISPKPTAEEDYPKDIFALEFLSDNHSILLSGGRRGILNLTDLRIPKFGPNSDIITHPSSVTHIKQLDTHRIIVAGLNSNLCQYDLRFRKTSPLSVARALESLSNPHPTRSTLQYPDFQNNASIQIGFDVDVEMGIVAAAQEPDEFHPSVQLFSLHGGHTLRAPGVSKNLPCIPAGEERHIKCLKFSKEMDGKIKSLYALTTGISRGIQRFAWVEDDEICPS